MQCFETTELPPRARRILTTPDSKLGGYGTTSACAENTSRKAWPILGSGNYLRVRGEYSSQSVSCSTRLELPPRARRIQPRTPLCFTGLGTTSACAENTQHHGIVDQCGWNYLRVRGEYCPQRILDRRRLELPPRARRIRHIPHSTHMASGTTSACAENTMIPPPFKRKEWNYLRVRGEYPK